MLLQMLATGRSMSNLSMSDSPTDPAGNKAPDVYGCSCGPGSPVTGDDCCSGLFNAEGQNCFTSGTSKTKGAICQGTLTSGTPLCCKDQFNAWCCESGSACIPQTAGRWNPHSCAHAPKTTPGSVKTKWHLAGGGPGAPPDMGITFKVGVTKSATRTETEDIKEAFEMSFEFGGFKVSNTFSAEWKTEVETSITTSEEHECTVKCPENYYVWVFKTEVEGIDTLPFNFRNIFASCSAVICSPFGSSHPPACPFGYQEDQADGFPCCTSLDWLDNPAAPDAPPLCPVPR